MASRHGRSLFMLFEDDEIQYAYQVTVTDGQATTPKYTFAEGAPTAFVNFGDGTASEAVTSGVELTHTYTTGGIYTVRLILAKQETYLTQVDISSDYVSGLLWATALSRFRSLTNLIDLWAVGFGAIGTLKVAR